MNRYTLSIRILIIMFLAVFIYGCPAEEVSIAIKVHAPCVADQPGNLATEMDGITFLSLTISGPDIDPKNKVFRVSLDDKGEMTDIPTGSSRVITVEGFQVMPTNEYTQPPLIKGSVGPLDIDSTLSGETIYIMVSKTNKVVRTTNGKRDGMCTTMSLPRVGHTATVLNDGRVLITGGVQLDGNGNINNDSFERTAEIYDPKTGTFESTNSTMSQRKAFHSAVLIKSTGEVLITGGLSIIEGKLTTVLTAEVYNPNSGSFNPTPKQHLNHARAYHTATYDDLSDSVVIGGGYRVDYTNRDDPVKMYLNSVEVYNTYSKRFETSQALTLAENRADHTSSLMKLTFPNNNQVKSFVLFVGGENSEGVLSSVEIYAAEGAEVLSSQSFNMMVPRTNHSAVVVGNGQLLITGGYKNKSSDGSSKTLEATAELINILKETPALGTVPLKDPRAEHVSFLAGDTVYLLGGYTSNDKLISLVEYIRIDNDLQSYGIDYLFNGSAHVELEKGRFQSRSVEIGNGIVLVLGGATKDVEHNNAIETSKLSELFIPQQ